MPYFLHLFLTKKTTCTLLAGVDYTTPATHPAATCLKSPVNRFTDYSGKMMGLLPTTRKYYRNRQLYLTLLYRNRSGLYSTVYLCIGCNICRKFRRWECTVYMYTYTKDIYSNSIHVSVHGHPFVCCFLGVVALMNEDTISF